ncbi:PLP-dependent aminotransferase family protein [Bradyrhizobium sp. Gha]|uniref:aminotransferase-like domain-containing protein n=1 Tax=Bradyrhizobium sp. Gha TaxID=1855318 RepID=UPI0008DF097C|nr:PLP-dependent aminotransferase family protein [Bradyrhizobium sp. Gha]SFK29590.1 DNA-binding transcriptional regulator, MocR family, contains an aminotransferase domain [Bradyrhizobium sp. Gha]
MDARALASPSSQRFRDRAISPDGVIQLTLNHPPPVPEIFNTMVFKALNRVLAESLPAELMATHRWMGTDHERQQGALFVGRRLGVVPDRNRIIVTHSTQAALQVLLPGIVGNRRPLAIERLSYSPVRSFAARYGISVVDVSIDGDGLNPEAFREICHRKRPIALYLVSTYQNPTTVTMSLGRRQQIAEIARRYQVRLIEDDIYSLLTESPLPPISSLAPELSWYLLGTAKSLSAGLRLAFVVAPDVAEATRVFWPGLPATYWMASPISAALMAELVSNGGDLAILAAVKDELAARHRLVVSGLKGKPLASDPGCLHVWIPLKGASSNEIAAALLEAGVQVAVSASYAGDGWAPPQAIRISIGNPEKRSVLEKAMSIVCRALP